MRKADDGAGRRLRRHRLFAVELASDFPFRTPLGRPRGPAELLFVGHEDRPPVAPERLGEPLYRSRYGGAAGEGAVLYRTAEADVVRYPGVADYYLTARRIGCRRWPGVDPRELEVRFLGAVMAYWLESRGVLALHAAALAVGGRAVALAGANRCGKTTLAAALVAAGHSLVTDDILAIERGPSGPLARPGYPALRVSPAAASHLLGGTRGLEPVHPASPKLRLPVGGESFGAFAADKLPLAALYLLERGGEAPASVEPVARGDAVIELVRHSFSAALARAAGLEAGRLDLLSSLVRAAAVRRLVYPSGFARLPDAVAALLADLERGA